jgi:hypothetical protein
MVDKYCPRCKKTVAAQTVCTVCGNPVLFVDETAISVLIARVEEIEAEKKRRLTDASL